MKLYFGENTRSSSCIIFLALSIQELYKNKYIYTNQALINISTKDVNEAPSMALTNALYLELFKSTINMTLGTYKQ